MTKDPVKLREKVAYFFANFGNIPVMSLINSYLLIFYTTVCGIDPAACSVLFLLSRIMDAVTDSVTGFVLDHMPTSRMGHFRPTLILGSFICAINFALMWFGPLMFPAAKLVIAYVTYLLIGITFDIMDISLNSLLPVMTDNMKERNSLSGVKGVAYMAGAVIIGVAAPLILVDANKVDGYIPLITIFTLVIFLCSTLGALGVKERVRHADKSTYTFRQMFTIFRQKPVYTTFAVILLYTIGSNIVSAANSFYYTYVLGNLTLSSIVTLVSLVTILPATIVVGSLANRFGKKTMYGIGLAIAGAAGIFRLIDIHSVMILMGVTLLSGIGSGFVSPLNYSIQADNTDYVELKLNQGAEGAISALSSFISKFAAGIGGAIPGILLSMAGFDETLAVQSDPVIGVIIGCVVVAPAVFSLLGVAIFLKGYPLDKEALERQTAELHVRRGEIAAAKAAGAEGPVEAA